MGGWAVCVLVYTCNPCSHLVDHFFFAMPSRLLVFFILEPGLVKASLSCHSLLPAASTVLASSGAEIIKERKAPKKLPFAMVYTTVSRSMKKSCRS